MFLILKQFSCLDTRVELSLYRRKGDELGFLNNNNNETSDFEQSNSFEQASKSFSLDQWELVELNDAKKMEVEENHNSNNSNNSHNSLLDANISDLKAPKIQNGTFRFEK